MHMETKHIDTADHSLLVYLRNTGNTTTFFPQDYQMLWWRANARNVSFRNSLQWPIYNVNSVGKAKLYCISHQSFFRNLPRWLMLFIETMHGKVLTAKVKINAVLFIFVLWRYSYVMLCKSRNLSKIKGDKPSLLNHLFPQILAIILISYE